MLELSSDSIVLPYGFFHRKSKHIGYANIRAITEEKRYGQTVLIIHASTDYGKIAASLLSDTETYTAVKNFLFTKANLPMK
ncbi:MAG TPA: hypothetical protein VK815_09875 [Candidatus Acidoferrales bacterium]|jgi:hypothetical protein|nr:hypothetical protein [Candidatus Acidoferrales bacterium]